jgi:hypothetical protein
MRLKKLGAALVVVAALGAVLASSAFAAATQEAAQWYTGSGSGTLLSGSETATAEAIGTGTFETEVGKVKYVLQSTEIECAGCSVENSGGHAIGSGALKFKNVTVKEPAGCSVASEIETAALSVSADWMIGSTDYVKFTPAAGESTEFATVKITGCALATTLVPKGSVFVQAANATGVQATPQKITSSGAINATAGGNLHVGTKNATLAAEANFALGSGAPFGTH